MAELGWAGTVKRLALPKGISDLNDLYPDNHGRFVDRLHEAMEAAESVEGAEPGQVLVSNVVRELCADKTFTVTVGRGWETHAPSALTRSAPCPEGDPKGGGCRGTHRTEDGGEPDAPGYPRGSPRPRVAMMLR